ncbi:MAG: extracellular solute-binding protein [Deltaproteobacteria bacterium]|nr:extracellular solute-binding protein [Deltaproteobacteria bacterium]
MIRIFSVAIFLGLSLWFAQSAVSEPLPKSTQKMLKEYKLNPSVLADLDKQLNVPKEWIEKAKQEKKLKVRGSPATSKELRALFTPFNERYSFIEVDYTGANRQGRTIKTLMAYRTGRYLADMVLSTGVFVKDFQNSGGIENLSDLPAFKDVPNQLKDQNGMYVGINKNYWCMSYNTRLVKKKDLPKTWDDLLTNPIWRNGNLALGNRPNLWAVNLWRAKGEAWGKDFITRLFTEVKPQLRKEGMNALTQLVAAGEFYAAIPSNYKRPYQIQQDGAPVSFACPEPVPGSTEEAIILKGAPNLYSAKILMNWLLSKEGQIAQYAHEFAAPLDEGLRPKLLPFSDQIIGKQEVFRDPRSMEELMPKLFDFWNKLWLRGGGSAR